MQTIQIFLLICILTILSFFILPSHLIETEFPVYRVILDPGHGGLRYLNKKNHGDRYDKISEKYLKHYNAGVRYKNLEEHAIAYSIAKKVKDILDLSSDGKNFNRFIEIIKQFSDDNPPRIIIQSKLSRGELKSNKKISKNDDPNASFRLYDYPDKTDTFRKIEHGRISKINSYKPHLLVSIHMDIRPPDYYKGINPVIVAPHSFLHSGLQYLNKKITNKDFFYESPYAYWFVESVKKSNFYWFLKDTSVYFTGYPHNNKLRIKSKRFLGYRYNMVSWNYADPPHWEIIAKHHPKETQYAMSHNDFVMKGKFWERERSIYEGYRRKGGEDSYGGDNLYVSNEIIRYILYSLKLNGIRNSTQKLGKPYISIWSLPLLVNAVTAYIELGYLYKKRDRFLLTKKQDELAEGFAVGIYSLLVGLKPKNNKSKYMPKGKRVDLKKYCITSKKSYFDVVAEE